MKLLLLSRTIRTDTNERMSTIPKDTSKSIALAPVLSDGIPIEKDSVEAATVASKGKTAIASQKPQRFNI